MDGIELKQNEILVLRTSDKDRKSYNGFQWPESGDVSAPDWNGKPNCGGGLHGLPRGCGDACLLNWDETAVTQLVAVDVSQDYLEGVGELEQKCKFARGRVVFSKPNALREAGAILSATYPGMPVVAGTATAGDAGTATAGDRGTATAGHRGTATAGDRGTATAGHRGTATAGDAGTATAGDRGTATAGDRGTATAGDRGTATAGYAGTATAGYAGTATAGYAGTATAGHDGTATAGHRGTATAGDAGTATAGHDGTATAGHRGTATAGHRGTATAGHDGTATAGDRGILVLKSWDEETERWRLHSAYVGEDGIEPNVAYRLDGEGKFVKASV